MQNTHPFIQRPESNCSVTNPRLLCAGKGSGVHGSIKSGDLAGQQAAAKPSAAAPAKAPRAAGARFEDIPVTNMRAVIAKRLLESKTQLPHYYVTVNCQVDKVSYRKKIVFQLRHLLKIFGKNIIVLF